MHATYQPSPRYYAPNHLHMRASYPQHYTQQPYARQPYARHWYAQQPAVQQNPLAYRQPSAPSIPGCFYDVHSGTYYPLPITRSAPSSESYEEHLYEAGDGHSLWAILKEVLLVLFLLVLAIGVAMGCVYVMGFEEQVLGFIDTVTTWIRQLW